MALVQYSDSSDNENEDKAATLVPASRMGGEINSAELDLDITADSDDAKDHDLPPLPAAFHDLYTANVRLSTSDNSSLHGGRKRAVPHVQGNWPSHVYLEWIPSEIDSRGLFDLIDAVRHTIKAANKSSPSLRQMPRIVPSLQSDLGAPLPLHVSLSRTLQIKTDLREAFVDHVGSNVRSAAVQCFKFEFTKLKWVPNHERNRWFLVLAIKRPERDELNRLLRACNSAASICDLPNLYVGGWGDGPMEHNDRNHVAKRRKSHHEIENDVDRSEYFHITIAWNLEEPDTEWATVVQQIDVDKFVRRPSAPFDAVKARIGNVVHSFALKPTAAKKNVSGMSG